MKCDHCPVRPGLTCLGESHGPVCRDVADGMPGRAEQLIAIAEGDGRTMLGQEPPGPLAMAASFLGAMRRLLADGGRLAPRPVRKARRATCDACPHHDAVKDVCRVCGCGSVVPGGLAAKRAIAAAECPDTPPRWGPV